MFASTCRGLRDRLNKVLGIRTADCPCLRFDIIADRHEESEFLVESLEDRVMLAGDIDVDVRNGDLVIRGDNNSNEIAVRATDTAGTFVVEALDGESINGIAGFVEFAGVTDDFKINLKSGNNSLILTARDIQGKNDFTFSVPDELNIKTGNGNDAIVLDTISVGSDVGIKTKGGADAVTLNEVEIDDDLLIKTGSGGDAVNSLTNSLVDGDTRILTGTGNDCILTVLTEFDDEVTIKTGGGNDLIASALSTFDDELNLNGGGGIDEVFDFDNTFNGDVSERGIEDEFDGTITDVVNIFRDKPTFLTNLALLQTEGTNSPIIC